MMMKILKIGGLVLLAFLSACEPTRFVSVPVEYSARILFRPDSTSILLINQFDLSQQTKFNKRQLSVIKSGIATSVKYAQAQLVQLSNVKVINLVDTTSFVINKDSVNYLALKYHADDVLALQSFGAGIDLSAIDNSTVSYNSNVEVHYKLFANGGVIYKTLDGSVNQALTDLPNMGFFGNLIMTPGIGGNRKSIVSLAEQATKMALQDYLPYTITHNRPLYNDDWLQPAIQQIYAGNFEKADTLLKPFLKDANVKTVSKAAYMLAIVYESEGDVNLAIDLAQQSYDKFNNVYAEAILNDLKTE
ncbi:hypothetical protein [Mucilaginibacter sp.]|uniref:hypothetical protein n=1 Tax=Mucilaginibacter sp. TaxID=1882438 RepID=UPI0028400BD1|nr:hypothetical protein [Mucilaginibacter sp.]MDR3695195.1 hypothetical protein [Mucilaginibacter sp.]